MHRLVVLRLLGMALLVSLALNASSALAQETENQTTNAGLQAGAMLCTLLYGPVKLVYAGVGMLGSGLAYALTAGDRDVAWPIFVASVYGDYLVTPRHLTGDTPLLFVGEESEATTAPSDAAPVEPF